MKRKNNKGAFSRRNWLKLSAGGVGIGLLIVELGSKLFYPEKAVARRIGNSKNFYSIPAVVEVVNRMALTTDQRDWERCRASFTDQLEVDYTSLLGGEPELMLADDLIERWKGVLPGFDATQHLLGSHSVQINGNAAQCVCQFQAKHILRDAQGGELWTLYGRYDTQLVLEQWNEWRINKLRMTAIYSEGNDKLFELATARVRNQAT